MGKAAEARKDELVIAALIASPTVREAAKVCGVSETQVFARLRKPEFMQRYDAARREVLAQSTAYVQGIVSDAIRKMHEIMTNPDVAPQTQLNAADAIIRTALRLTEQIDILSQIEELNRAVFADE